MIISATLRNTKQDNTITVRTDNNQKNVTIPGKTEGRGSAVNGGELLFLSLATCFCNDIYREAERRKMEINSIDVTVTGEFAMEGEPGSNIAYQVKVEAPGNSVQEIDELIERVDKVAEIHNTLRKGVPVSLRK